MKKIQLSFLFLILCTILSACELVEGVFKAGMYTGIFFVILFVALIFWIIAKVKGRL